jgi:DNA polymerase-3 subunit delta'
VIYPWLETLWLQWIALGERLPHAILIAGPPGLGKRDLAEALAARLLCETPAVDGQACGHCTPCQWRLSGNHPDLRRLVPESEENPPATGEAAESSEPGSEGKATKLSTQIVIDQVRALQEGLNVTSHRGGRRAVIVDPPEAMNLYTANALLKLLEEPPDGCAFLLVSSAPRRLLPTIRSRCQQWRAQQPDAAALRRWQEGQGEGEGACVSVSLLALCGGMPLAAKRLADQGGETLFSRFVSDLGTNEIDPLRLAAQWENWIKKDKTALAAGFGLPALVEWTQRWVSDLAALRLGGRVRYFPAQRECLTRLSTRMSLAAAGGCYNEFIQFRRAATHPLNPRLFLEDMLMRYARVLSHPDLKVVDCV